MGNSAYSQRLKSLDNDTECSNSFDLCAVRCSQGLSSSGIRYKTETITFNRKSVFFQFGGRTPVPRAPRKDQGQSGGRRREGNLGKAFVLLLLEKQGRQS